MNLTSTEVSIFSVFLKLELFWMNNKAIIAGCYPPPPSASVDNTFLDLQNSSYPAQPHSLWLLLSVLYLVFLKISSTISDDYDDDDDDNYVSRSELLTELLIEWGQR